MANTKDNSKEKFHWAALGVSKTFSGHGELLLQLKECFGSIRDFYGASERALRASGLLAPRAVERFLQMRDRDLPARLEESCSRLGIGLITLEDKAYPPLLREIRKPPLALYVKGTLPDTDQCVAIVGPRLADEYGRKSAAWFARALTEAGLTIVSGGAQGIDTISHEASLEAGGTTISILGCGVDIPYPYANRDLFKTISKRGAILSEYPPGTRPERYHFPERNRIISGICRGVLVIEASPRSGALITAEYAADEGRSVFCIPGSIYSQLCRGTNDLIRRCQGIPVLEPAHILEELFPRWQGREGSNLFPNSGNRPAAACTDTERKILDYLSKGPVLPEELAAFLGRGPLDMHVYLTQMQMKGLVGRDACGRWFQTV